MCETVPVDDHFDAVVVLLLALIRGSTCRRSCTSTRSSSTAPTSSRPPPPAPRGSSPTETQPSRRRCTRNPRLCPAEARQGSQRDKLPPVGQTTTAEQ